MDNRWSNFDIFLQSRNCKLIDNHPSEVTVIVAFAWPTVFEWVAAKEKFAYVTTNTMLNYKLAAGMSTHKLINFQNQIV